MSTSPDTYDSLPSRGGICLCGAVDWSLWFGGKRDPRFICGKCGRRYDLDGVLGGGPA